MANILPIVSLPCRHLMVQEEILSVTERGLIAACDFYIEGAENSERTDYGFRDGRILNIDHHAPVPWMARMVSSTNLAIEGVRTGVLGEVGTVVINHTDCDSVLSSAIVAGMLGPDQDFGEAALAADHTGEENDIADLLQILSPYRDFSFSFRNLVSLLRGRRLDEAAQESLSERKRRRELAGKAVDSGMFNDHNGVFWAELPEEVDGEFFPALLPAAHVIVTASPHPKKPWKKSVKLRLGMAAPEGFTLHDMNITQLDSLYGGRWNAGSNKRGGGSDLPAKEYALHIASHLDHPKKKERRSL